MTATIIGGCITVGAAIIAALIGIIFKSRKKDVSINQNAHDKSTVIGIQNNYGRKKSK